jgi:hypothetical protein
MVIFAGSSAEKRGFPPNYAAYGGAKPFGFCSVYLQK